MGMDVRSKKAFTLVELVVVIAVLAILAAIAIPAVVSVINTANNAASETNASTLDKACKEFYNGVNAGNINQQSCAALSFKDSLPPLGASHTLKHKKALAVTPDMAQEYMGLDFDYDDYVYVSADNAGYFRGTILYAYSDAVQNDLSGKVTPLGTGGTTTVTLGKMYNLK